MKIKSLTFYNYRPYIGDFSIDFADGSDKYDNKNLTVIIGGNDFGKTNFLNGVSWCIYGDEPYKEGIKRVFNQSAAKALKVNEKLDVYVEILMENNEGKEVLFKREQKFIKRSNGMRKVYDPKFSIEIINKNGKNKKVTDPKKYRETHLPDGLQQYFLFDGEQLLKWLKKDPKSLKEAVDKLSQFDLVGKVKDNTETQRDNLTDELIDLNYKKGEFIKEKNRLENAINEDKKKLEELNTEINELEKNEESLNSFIMDKGGDPAALKKELDLFEEILDKYEDDLNELKQKRLDYLLKNFYLILGNPFLRDLNKFKDDSMDINQEYEFNISIEDIDQLLNNKKCICGCDLSENDEHVDSLLRFKDMLIEISNKPPEEKEFKNLLKESENIINDFPVDFKEDMRDHYQKISDMEQSIKTQTELKDEKQEKYDVLLENKIPEKKEKLDRTTKLLNEYREQRVLLESNIETLEEELKKVKTDIDIDETKDDIVSEIENKISFCDNIIESCINIENKFGKMIHKDLERIVNEEFQSIYNGDGNRGKYKQIHIDESLTLTFEEYDGVKSSSTDPSSGTQLALAISFITAINKSSAYKIPQIMDTSLGKWDNTLRRNFALALPKYLDDIQMVFLFLDSEFNEEFEIITGPYIGEKHVLIRENENETLLKPKKEKKGD